MAPNRKPLPSREFLLECFDTREIGLGVLYWKVRPESHFKTDAACRGCNTQNAGKKAGRIGRRYVNVVIQGSAYRLHRIIYFLATGIEPDVIDHIDGDKTNNHPDNLRQSNNSQNGFNIRSQSRNTTGYRGVSINKGRYQAHIMKNRKEIWIGYFDTAEEASRAYMAAAAKLHADTPIREKYHKSTVED